MSVSDVDMLSNIQDAITATLLSQEYRNNALWNTRPSLETLRSMEKEYQARVNSVNGIKVTGISINHG